MTTQTQPKASKGITLGEAIAILAPASLFAVGLVMLVLQYGFQ